MECQQSADIWRETIQAVAELSVLDRRGRCWQRDRARLGAGHGGADLRLRKTM